MINNDFYDTLHDDWYSATDHPIALLRAENAVRVPWIIQEIQNKTKGKSVDLLDVGCGGGFLTNALALKGHTVTGIDLSTTSLDIAKKHDRSGGVRYLQANAYNLPFANESFDVVCAMDILEHVEEPDRLIQEASRLLRPGGLFFFHTFNRNPLSYLLIIKGVDWFVPNAPKNMHVYSLFIKPQELTQLIHHHGLKDEKLFGFVPDFLSGSLWKLLITRRVPSDFKFKFCRDLSTGYCGFAIKQHHFS